MDAAGLEDDLRRSVAGEVRFDAGTRAVYATDASNFRRLPIGVVLPATVEDVAAVHRVCRDHGAPIVPRGCGTGLAGGAVNEAVVIDCSRHLDAVGPIDPAHRLARAEPGAINDRVNEAAAAHGLRFGPDPATHAYCTIGGNIATNACGTHSLQARFEGRGSRTSDNLARLDVLTYDGQRLTVGPTSDDELARIIAGGGRRGQIYRDLRDLRDRHAEQIRMRFPQIPRRVSGYNLDDLLPERGFNVAAALAGTEGTCVTILGATLALIPRPASRSLLAIGYPDGARVADHLDDILATRPTACEMLDRILLPANGPGLGGPRLPEGDAWVLVEFGGDTWAEARDRAGELAERLRHRSFPPSGLTLFEDPAAEAAVWKIRETGLARSSFPEGAYRRAGDARSPGWEDSAVAPQDVGAYLRDLGALSDRHGYRRAFYGHLGDGCIHTRFDFDLKTPEGLARYRAFLEEAADLVVSYGGSLSGEHGDVQQRAELLPRMFGEDLVRAFGAFKAIWDPDGRMNPGKIVAPSGLDQDLRATPGPRPTSPVPLRFAYPEGGGDFARATRRCVGVGACRRPDPAETMCPSFMATRDERHTTRGRARLLAELLDGHLEGGWRNSEVREALDLCLACKGCTSDCPTGVDLPTYKAEFLHQHWHGRLRPRAAYALGLIDRAARLASVMPGAANLVIRTPPLARALRRAGGIAPQRVLPTFAPLTLQEWFRRRGPRNLTGPSVIVWPDTFTNYIDTGVGVAAIEAIEAAGWRVRMPLGHQCCGRPLYDFGFLDLAERYLRATLDALRPLLRPGIPVVGIEPSCVATLRHELPRLLPRDDEALALSRQALHFSEFFTRYELAAPRVPGWRVALWTHCHQRATGTGDPDRLLLEALGAEVTVIQGSCCGLAGAWGYEAGHYGLSMVIGEHGLLPAVRTADAETLIVANGFSCRQQILQAGGGRRGLHVAQVLQQAAQGTQTGTQGAHPAPSGPPAAPAGVRARRAAIVGALGAATAAGFLIRRRASWRGSII